LKTGVTSSKTGYQLYTTGFEQISSCCW